MPTNWTWRSLEGKVKYVQNDWHDNLMKAMTHVSPKGENSLEHWDVVEGHRYEVPYGHEQCCCTHKIKYCHYIKHKTTGDTMLVGSKCVLRWKNPRLTGQLNEIILKRKYPDRVVCWCCHKTVSREPTMDEDGRVREAHYKCLLKIGVDQMKSLTLPQLVQVKAARTRDVEMKEKAKERRAEALRAEVVKAKQRQAADYCLKYGKHAGKTLGEVISLPGGVGYLTFLAKHTRSSNLRKAIILCARGKQNRP